MRNVLAVARNDCNARKTIRMQSEKETTETVLDDHNDSGQWLKWMPNERFAIRIASSDTNGRYTSLEVVAQGSGPPLHIHHNEDEHFIILEGSVCFICGVHQFEASAGESVTIPKGVKHTWRISSSKPARMLLTFAPGGFEKAFTAVVDVPESDLEATLANYGCTIEGPPLTIE